jgi:hypothetical protein
VTVAQPEAGNHGDSESDRTEGHGGGCRALARVSDSLRVTGNLNVRSQIASVGAAFPLLVRSRGLGFEMLTCSSPAAAGRGRGSSGESGFQRWGNSSCMMLTGKPPRPLAAYAGRLIDSDHIRVAAASESFSRGWSPCRMGTFKLGTHSTFRIHLAADSDHHWHHRAGMIESRGTGIMTRIEMKDRG